MPTGRRIASIILAASILLGLSVVLIAEGRSAGEVGEGSERGAQPLVERSQAIPLAPLMGSLYFSANDDTHGRELWKSDGTAAGTVIVKDIRPGSEGSYPGELTDVEGTLYFAADDGTHGCGALEERRDRCRDRHGEGHLARLGWRFRFPVLDLTDVGGTLFFSGADDGTTASELWKSDGTAAGTVMVKDIMPGPDPSFPDDFTDVGGTLFFRPTTARTVGSSGRATGPLPGPSW